MAYGMYEILRLLRKEKTHTKNRGFEFFTDSVPFLLLTYDIEDGIWQIRNFTRSVKLEKPDDFSQARISNTDFEKPQTKDRGFDLSGEAIFSEIPVLQGDFIPVREGAAHLKRMRKVEAGSGF